MPPQTHQLPTPRALRLTLIMDEVQRKEKTINLSIKDNFADIAASKIELKSCRRLCIELKTIIIFLI